MNYHGQIISRRSYRRRSSWLLPLMTLVVAFISNADKASSFIVPVVRHTLAAGRSHYSRRPSALTLSAIQPPQPSARRPGTPFIRTLLIDNYDSYTYNLAHYLTTVNGVPPVVVCNDAFAGDWKSLLASVGPIDNVVISPGPGTPENPDDFGLCKEALLQSQLPVLGE